MADSAADELQNLREQLRLSEQRLKSSQKIARIGSWELEIADPENLDDGPLYWSDQTYGIFGHQPGEFEVSNENFLRCVHPEDREALQRAVRKALQTGENYDIEHRIILPDGSIRFVHELSEVIADPATGKPVRMLGTVQDITEKKKFRDQLIVAQKMECVGRLSSGIAHDFNNLLCAIYGNLEVLDSQIPRGSSATRYVKNIRAAAERAADLTRRLLAFSRQQILSPSIRNLNDLVLEANEMLGPILSDRIEVCLSLAREMGTIEVDESQLSQIILNLAINARDAMPDGGTLKISTSQINLEDTTRPRRLEVKSGRYARLTVSDNGHGMTEDVLMNIFEPFFTTKTSGKGTGLGLATVYGIVKQSGGYIWAESEPGKGSTFEILLPIVEKKRRSRPSRRQLKARDRVSSLN